VVVQAGLEFDINTGAALYSTVTAKVAAEIAVEVFAKTELNLNCGSGNP
jgi:hypothetical protein